MDKAWAWTSMSFNVAINFMIIPVAWWVCLVSSPVEVVL